MRIITEGRKATIRLWGNPKPQDTRYRLIRYHVWDENEAGVILLNTVTGELVQLEPDEAVFLTSTPVAYRPEMDELIAHHFLVPETFDDLKSVNQLRILLKRLNTNRDIGGYIILPTTACNARCFYCFESNEPHHMMTEEMANKVVEYIKSHCGERKNITIKWFGGEPTLGEERIDQICDLLREDGITYTSTMISNAYLFSREMAHKAKEKWKLQFIQITLDGTEQVYNRVKAFVNAKDSPYQRVMDNIGYLLDEDVRVSLRMNLDYHNADDLHNLIDELANRFANRKNFSAYVATLFEKCGYEPVHHTVLQQDELTDIEISLNHLIKEKGCNQTKRFQKEDELPYLKANFCMSDNPNSIVINPLGQFGKCEHELYHHLVGSVDEGVDYGLSETRQWLEPTYQIECESCPLYPKCGLIIACDTRSPCSQKQRAEMIGDVKCQMRYRLKGIQSKKFAGGKM